MSDGRLTPGGLTGFGHQVSGPPIGVLAPGPVWHASVMAGSEALGWAMAERALRGVGAAELGEWRETGRAVHLRRRLTDAERQAAGGLVVRDIRGLPEEGRRRRRLLRDAPDLRSILTFTGSPG